MKPIAFVVLLATVYGCSIPGFYREGRRSSVEGEVPANTFEVSGRVHDWYQRNGFQLTDESSDGRITGVAPIRREGTSEWRSELTFTVTASGANRTAYRLLGRTVVVTDGRSNVVDLAPETAQHVSALASHISCAAARWPACP